MDRIESKYRHRSIREIPGIELSGNAEARMVEGVTGMEYLRGGPLKVRLNPTQNRLTIRTHEPQLYREVGELIGPPLGIGRVVTVLLGNRLNLGLTIPELRTILTWAETGKEEYVALHENGHFLVDEKNPYLTAYRVFYNNTYRDSNGKIVGSTKDDDDKNRTFAVFEEGMAEWIAAEVLGTRRGITDLQELREYHIRTLRKPSQAVRKIIEAASYYVGHLFVIEGMYVLRTAGLSQKDALNLFIDNPPISLAQIRGFSSYAYTLLGR